MAEILAVGAAAWLGWKAARRVRRAYVSAKEDMYYEQNGMGYYDQPPPYYSQPPPPYSRGGYGSGHHHHSGRSHSYR